MSSTPVVAASRCCSTRSSRWSPAGRSPSPSSSTRRCSVEAHLAGSDVASLRYEVMYLLEAEDATIPAFKQTWAALGDSIVVVGGDGLWNCHVHTDDIGGAIEAGIEAGRPRHIRVTDLLEQVEEEQWVREQDAALADMSGATEPARAPESEVETAVVAVGVGEGIRRLLVEPRRARDRGRWSVDEPVDGADPRSGGALPVGARWSCCRTTRTSCPVALPGGRADDERRRGRRRPRPSSRRSRRSSRTTRTPSSTTT